MRVVQSPVRVVFGSPGTDRPVYYQRYGSLTLGAAIDRYVRVAIQDAPGQPITIGPMSEQSGQAVVSIYGELTRQVLEHTGITEGVRLELDADVPPGYGLGVSRALLAALIGALTVWRGQPLDPRLTATEAAALHRLMRPDFSGEAAIYFSALGGLNILMLEADEVNIEPIRLTPEQQTWLQLHLQLFIHPGARLTGENRPAFDAHTFSTDTLHNNKAYNVELIDALSAANILRLGRLLDNDWLRRRQLVYPVRMRQFEEWYGVARQAGMIGGQFVCGAQGGAFLACVPPEQSETLKEMLATKGWQHLPFAFDMQGLRLAET
jgi:D-glycero-alpha-D-manno-heptose-7-phosphate kinase